MWKVLRSTCWWTSRGNHRPSPFTSGRSFHTSATSRQQLKPVILTILSVLTKHGNSARTISWARSKSECHASAHRRTKCSSPPHKFGNLHGLSSDIHSWPRSRVCWLSHHIFRHGEERDGRGSEERATCFSRRSCALSPSLRNTRFHS